MRCFAANTSRHWLGSSVAGRRSSLTAFDRINACWNDIKSDLVANVDQNYGCYEFAGQLSRTSVRNVSSPTPAGNASPGRSFDGGKPDLRSETFRAMV